MLLRLLPLLLLLLLAACATTPRSPLEAQSEHALALYRSGQFEDAADLYLALAKHAQKAGQRARFQLMAADSLLQAGEEDKARALLQSLDTKALPDSLRPRQRLLQAQLRVLEKDADQALALLEGLERSTDPDIVRRALQLRARAHELNGDPLAQARTLMRLDPLLPDEQQRLRLQLKLLSLLVRLPTQSLKSGLPPDSTGQGWAELAELVRSFPNDPQGVAAPYREWQSLYPEHPALPQLLAAWYEQQQRLMPASFHHVAVLLPQSGPFAQAAAAIRAGILAAWQAAPGETRPLLTFHDSSDPQKLWPLLNQVAQAGADMVIGPLAKENVLQLARAGSLPLPVLALNRVQSDTLPPPQLYQYALAPEEEAHQAALWAAANGLRLPGVLYPANTLGERLLNAFREQWQTLDRGEIRSQVFHPSQNDYSDAVAELFQIAQAKAKHDRLEKAAGKKLPFEPELPVDFVFVVGNKADLLQLRPLIRFHHGSKLPALATSRAWKGRLTASEALDLDGLLVPETPWLAEPESNRFPLSPQRAKQLFPESFHRYPRLIAMGMDAYDLLPELNRLGVPGQPPLAGATGELTLDNRHLVHRRLTWIRLGDPVQVLGPTPPAESIDTSGWETVPESGPEATEDGSQDETTAPAQR